MKTEQNWKIGDCQELMKEMEPDSVDLVGFELDPRWESLYSNRAMKNIPNLLNFGV